jgi:hypothetical protein
LKPITDHRPTTLSDDLRMILDHAAGKAISLGEIVGVLRGRGFDVLVIILALPFCQPIPLPGLSTPFGLALMFFGFRIALRQRPWLPAWILRRRISHETLTKLVKGALAVARRMEKVVHPRLRFFKNWPSFTFLNGLAIVSSSFLLMLPLPIPFSNTIPAWAIVLLAAGMMEEDGAVIVAGYFMAGAAWTYLATLWWLGEAGIDRLGIL